MHRGNEAILRYCSIISLYLDEARGTRDNTGGDDDDDDDDDDDEQTVSKK